MSLELIITPYQMGNIALHRKSSLMNSTQAFTVIFLIDQVPPQQILLLRRAESKSFAPGYYTGIGGKVGDSPTFANETVLEGAYRELQEETLGEVSNYTTMLTEFARFHYLDGIDIHYFWGCFAYPQIPKIAETDGTLEWVSRDRLLEYKIIPTTELICQIWEMNQFSFQPFTVVGRETGMDGTVRLVAMVEHQGGLLSFEEGE